MRLRMRRGVGAREHCGPLALCHVASSEATSADSFSGTPTWAGIQYVNPFFAILVYSPQYPVKCTALIVVWETQLMT